MKNGGVQEQPNSQNDIAGSKSGRQEEEKRGRLQSRGRKSVAVVLVKVDIGRRS